MKAENCRMVRLAAETPATPKGTRLGRLVLSPSGLPRRRNVDQGFQLEGRTTQEVGRATWLGISAKGDNVKQRAKSTENPQHVLHHRVLHQTPETRARQ